MKRVKFSFTRWAKVEQTGKCWVDVPDGEPEEIIAEAEKKAEGLSFSRFLVKGDLFEDIDWDFDIEMIEDID